LTPQLRTLVGADASNYQPAARLAPRDGVATAARGYRPAHREATMTIQHLNPDGMLKSPAFSQGIVVPAGARTLVIGGQNGVDEHGHVVGPNLGEQTAKAVDNLIKVLEAAGGTLENLVRVGIYVKGDVDIRPGFEAWMQRWGRRPNPPTIVVLRVVGMGMSPDILVEIEATAALD
jgi:enamine deaminase RidA (YjgF/YER057c/UK114 family)